MFEIIMQLHKGGGSTTVTNSYTPSEEEKALMAQQGEFTKYIMPNAMSLNDSAANMFFDSLGDMQVDYKSLLDNANALTAGAQQGYMDLANGILPDTYTQNMTNAIQSGVQNTMGSALDSLASRGVLNSSVTNKAMNDISKNVSDTMAQQYINNVGLLGDIYGNQLNSAGAQMANAAAGQEAAQQPAMQAWNMSLGLGNQSTGALSAIAGKMGTSTNTQKMSGGGNGWLSGALGLATGLASGGAFGSGGIFCFTGDTMVRMADGTEKAIKELSVDDKVKCYNKTGDTDETIIALAEPKEMEIYKVKAGENEVLTTLSQPLMTEKGELVEVEIMKLGTMLKDVGKVEAIEKAGVDTVYDIKTTGSNCYYANGFIAYGAFDEELRGE